jgi:hypothetical protein
LNRIRFAYPPVLESISTLLRANRRPDLQVDTALMPQCARTISGAIIDRGKPETTTVETIKYLPGHVKTAPKASEPAAVAHLTLIRDDRRNEKRLNLTVKTAKKPRSDSFRAIGFEIKALDRIIGHRRMTIQPYSLWPR